MCCLSDLVGLPRFDESGLGVRGTLASSFVPSHGQAGSNQGQKAHCAKSRQSQSTCLCSRVIGHVKSLTRHSLHRDPVRTVIEARQPSSSKALVSK